MKPYYEHAGITIYHGDCRDILPTLPRVDLVVTDPPYEIRAGSGGGVFGTRDHLINTGGFTDCGVDYSFLDGFSDWFVCCSLKQLPELLGHARGKARHHLLTWCKPNPVPTCCNKYLPDVEYIVHGFSKGRLFGEMEHKASFALIPCGNKETDHPNEKPISLMTKCVTLGSLDGEIILDPFCGSGTTLRAAKDLGRKAFGIDKEERCCETSARRLEQEVLAL